MDTTTERPGTLVTDFNEFDVTLGRGKNANNRPGNIHFRKVAAEMAGEYKVADSIVRARITDEFIARIHAKGGRFLQSVTAANSQGEVVTLWEVVSMEKTVTKVKQALRDVGSERLIRSTAPSQPSLLGPESQRIGSSGTAVSATTGEELPLRTLDECKPSSQTVSHGSAVGSAGLQLPALPEAQQQQIAMIPPTTAQAQLQSLLSQQRLLARLQQQQHLQNALHFCGSSELNDPSAATARMIGPYSQQQQPFPPPILADQILPPGLRQEDARSSSWTMNTSQLPLSLLMQLQQQQPQQHVKLPHDQQLSDLLQQQSYIMRGGMNLPMVPAEPHNYPTQESNTLLEPLSANQLFLGSSSRTATASQEPEEKANPDDGAVALKRSASDAELEDYAEEQETTTEGRQRQRTVLLPHRPLHPLLSLEASGLPLPGGLVLPSALRQEQYPHDTTGLLPTVTTASAPLELDRPDQKQEDSSPESLTSSGAKSLLAAVVASAKGRSNSQSWSGTSDGGSDDKTSISNASSKNEDAAATAPDKNVDG